MEISENKNANTLFWRCVKTIGFSSIVLGLAIAVIWSYLLRIGRQDVLLDTFKFKDLFSITGIAFIVGCVLFSFVYFTPSIFSGLVIKRNIANYFSYEKVKKRYLLAWYLTSVIAFLMVLYLSWFMPDEKHKFLVMMPFFVLTSFICIAISSMLNKKMVSGKTLFMDKKESMRFKIKMHIAIPGAIGLASWVYVFPLSLLLHELKSIPGESFLSQIADVLMLGGIVLVTSLIPAIVYFNTAAQTPLFKQIEKIAGTVVVVMVLLSLILPVIPALLLNFTMKMTGVVDIVPYTYSFSTKIYPEEAFSSKDWSVSRSKNNDFLLIEGVSLFSFGDIKLVCPVILKNEYIESMRYVFASRDYDEQQRISLQKSSKECRVFGRNEIKRLSPLS